MDHHHTSHPVSGGALDVVLPVLAPLVCAGGYLLLASRARRRHPVRAWSAWRSTAFCAGVLLLAVALLPPVAPFAHRDFRGHMVQHLLIGMYAPLALVLGAPVTLVLRAVSAPRARRLAAVLHSGPARLLSRPAVALPLSAGSLPVLYFTPLYDTAMAHPAGHWLVHAHSLLSGCLFAHAVAGPDPAPARPGVPARLAWLGCAIAVHAVAAQLMYGGFWVDVHAPASEVRGGAEIMYYGGDIAELLLAAALVATWRPGRRPFTRPVPLRPARPSG
ncbi:cytochrome c oxidase assembly protein [Streptomyces sp. NPDC006658]|uniref:cytochrome c oxidase assembly protein n=1 Tax=Streptomyces sp. NPDC006658 TaxID=3156900 RepID=UPI00340153A2